MRFHFDITDLQEEAREERSKQAFGEFFNWAVGDGKQPVSLPLRMREAALIVATLAHHAAGVAEQGGDPTVLVEIAVHVVREMDKVLGRQEVERIISMCSTMMTGVE